jgi:hypothetical protein
MVRTEDGQKSSAFGNSTCECLRLIYGACEVVARVTGRGVLQW